MTGHRFITALTIAGAVLLASCGSDSSSSGGASETLTIWTWKENHVPALEEIGREWAAATGKDVTVDVEFYAESDGVYANKISAATRTGDLPDLLSYWGGAHWDVAGQGILADITDDVDEEWLSQFPESLHGGIVLSEALVDACEENSDCEYKDLPAGAIYALPQISGATGYVFANRQLLRAAGVDADNPPDSWEDWIAAMQKTVDTDARRGGLALGLKVPETGYLWVYRLLSWSHLGPDEYEARFAAEGDWTSPESLETFELHDQLSSLWNPAALQTDISEAEAAFGRGDAAWLIGGTFSYSTLAQAGIDPADVMVFPLPTSETDEIRDRELKPWVSLMLGITKDADDRELALDFLRYLFSADGGAAFAEQAQDLPAVKVPTSSAANQTLVATQDAFSDSDEAFDEMVPRGPQCEAASTVTNQAAVALTRLITKEKSAQQVAEEFQQIFDTAWAECGG